MRRDRSARPRCVFDVVLLASCLIDHPLPATRVAFARAARRHLTEGGRLLLQRPDPRWPNDVQPGPAGSIGAIAVSVEAVCRTTAPMTMTLRYDLADAVWRQSFAVVPLDEEEIESLPGAQGFARFEWIGSRRPWSSSVATAVAPVLGA